VHSHQGNAADKLSYSEDEDDDDQPAAFTSLVASPLGRMHVSDLPDTARRRQTDISSHDDEYSPEDLTALPDETLEDQYSPSGEAREDQFSNFRDKMSTGKNR